MLGGGSGEGNAGSVGVDVSFGGVFEEVFSCVLGDHVRPVRGVIGVDFYGFAVRTLLNQNGRGRH